MTTESLADAIAKQEGPVAFLRANHGRHPYPVRDEFTNWIDEQRSWNESCSLSDLSHHQRDLTVTGPDVLDLFKNLGLNDFDGFTPGEAKQFITCNSNGYVIGDGILFFLTKDEVQLTGTPIVSHWVEYNIERWDFDVDFHVEERYHDKDRPHETFRYQVQGPKASVVMDAVADDPVPNIPFFTFQEVSIEGRAVNVLGHSMAREPGYELWGSWEDADVIRDLILAEGESYDIHQIGEKAYKAPKGGDWIPRPLPAIFSPDMADYRKWLQADGYEGISSLGGSYESDDIEDYYLTPVELGYDRFMNHDRDFVGREAIEAQLESTSRKKVTLVWEPDDILEILGSLFKQGKPAKYFDFSSPFWSVFHYDVVQSDGETAGVSKYFGYSYNERAVLSLALLDPEYVEFGETVEVHWGEPGGNSANPAVEPHKPMTIEAIVAPAPYVQNQ